MKALAWRDTTDIRCDSVPDAHQDEDGFRHAAVAYFGEHHAVYELKAQLWSDAERQPIEDASVDWPIKVSPYRTAETLRLPRREACGPVRVRYFDEDRRTHSRAANRPVGSVMGRVYWALSNFRHRENDVTPANTSDVAQIPA